MDWKYPIQYLDHSRVLFRSNIILDTRIKYCLGRKCPKGKGWTTFSLPLASQLPFYSLQRMSSHQNAVEKT